MECQSLSAAECPPLPKVPVIPFRPSSPWTVRGGMTGPPSTAGLGTPPPSLMFPPRRARSLVCH